MRYVRKLCISAIILLYLLGTVPAFMHFYNRPVTILGIPCFAVGIISLAFGMLLFVYILYRCGPSEDEDEKGGQ